MDKELLIEDFRNSLKTLTDREWGMLERRFGLVDGQARTYQQLSQEWSLSRERCRQITLTGQRKLSASYDGKVSVEDVRNSLDRLEFSLEQECLYRRVGDCQIVSHKAHDLFSMVFNVEL